MIISLIVAASENNVIGKNNQLLWSLPNDMRFFKNTTWGMPVIMGRKTFESFKAGPLPGRFNFVITHQPAFLFNDQRVKVAGTLQEAISMANQTDCKEGFVIGGGQVYAQALPIAKKIYLTRVHVHLEGDAFFPDFNKNEWKLISKDDREKDEKHAYSYSFEIWVRNQ
ncbi:MAG: dihydrofolate reductase [Chitinophagales bacterium]